MTKLLFVPNLSTQRGWGHFYRCVRTASQIGLEAAVLVVKTDTSDAITWEKSKFSLNDCRLQKTWPLPGEFSAIIVDQQACSPSLYQRLRTLGAFLVGWDEGGPHRKDMDYLVDSLPNLAKTLPNLYMPSLALEEPTFTPPQFSSKVPQNVLIVFGGGDPKGLTLPTVQAWKKVVDQKSSPLKISLTVVRGPGAQFPRSLAESDITLWDNPENLTSQLAQFDLVLGSWGLTTLEALAKGIPVILAAPTPYHARLQHQLGLATFSPSKPQTLAQALKTCTWKSQAYVNRIKISGPSAPVFWKNFLLPPKKDPCCPVCGSIQHRFLARTPEKSYFQCNTCQMEYMLPFQLPAKQYEASYFFEDYQRQYGKTYLEDFQAISAMGRARILYSQKWWGSWKGFRLLDVGCAFGPFLSAAQDVGAEPFGWDISAEATEYVKTKLGFPAVAEPFPGRKWEEVFPGMAKPNVVTLWYVIEHFPNLKEVLESLAEVLPLGGHLALGTPNGKGISRLFSSQKFWKISPEDHFTIWNPQNSRQILRKFGFRVDGIRITGHHPERFPGIRQTGSRQNGFFFRIIKLLDRWLGWGDTFEIYATKIRTVERNPL